MARRDTARDWTAGRRGRGRRRPEIVDVSSMPRIVSTVAFDQFVLDERGLVASDGSTLVRGTSTDGTSIAVGSAPWPGMPIEWVALQSRRAPDLLALVDDEMEPVGHRQFDDRVAVDADDVSRFRKQFRTSLREWFVDFDDAHAPLIVVFDGAAGAQPPTPQPPTPQPPTPQPPTPQRRATDETTNQDADPDPANVPTVFLARVVDDDASIVPTLELAARVRSAVEH